MQFTKMHGCGNDFVVLQPQSDHAVDDLARRATQLCDRRRGIGADGIVCVLPAKDADFRMRIINADGSEPEMCGNGIRCFARYVQQMGLTSNPKISISTLAGPIGTEFVGDLVRVDMGVPHLAGKEVPVDLAAPQVIDHTIEAGDQRFKITAVSMGNPHAVIHVPELSDKLVLEYGPLLESHPFFPRKTNVDFIRVDSAEEITMRVFERGVGETEACGTGACASMVAGVLTGRNGKKVTVHLLGGDLVVEWSGSEIDPVYMTGPALSVFEGTLS